MDGYARASLDPGYQVTPNRVTKPSYSPQPPLKSASVGVALPPAYRKLSKKLENDRLGVVARAAYLDTDGRATKFDNRKISQDDDAENRTHRYGCVLRFRRTAG